MQSNQNNQGDNQNNQGQRQANSSGVQTRSMLRKRQREEQEALSAAQEENVEPAT